MTIDIPAIEAVMCQEGEGWAIAHARRLLDLIERIGANLDYSTEALCWAAYLHDWGAFHRYYQPGCDHAAISRQVAESEILPSVDLPTAVKEIILDAIALHDYRDPRPVVSIEARLLREADMLDLLGTIGIAREFAWGPNDLEICYRRILSRRDAIRGRLPGFTPAARELAEIRLARMDICLQWFDEERSCTDRNPEPDPKQHPTKLASQ